MRELVAAPPASIAEAVRGWFSNPYDGRAKLWLIHRALAFRNQHAALVAGGDYLALAASGAHARHVLAFARRHRDEVMIVIAGRLFASLGLEPGALPLGDPAWADAALDVGFLPDDTLLTNALTNDAVVVAGGRLRLSAIFATFPGALLSCSTARPPAR
jgi:(1->4)-alpha-D-glucan 1-alpha-D-glucosylmutase